MACADLFQTTEDGHRQLLGDWQQPLQPECRGRCEGVRRPPPASPVARRTGQAGAVSVSGRAKEATPATGSPARPHDSGCRWGWNRRRPAAALRRGRGRRCSHAAPAAGFRGSPGGRLASAETRHRRPYRRRLHVRHPHAGLPGRTEGGPGPRRNREPEALIAPGGDPS